MGKRIVIALGGNALGKNLPEQMLAVKETSKAIADLVEAGHTVAVAHGNGPQVGMIQNAFAAYCRQEPSADVMPLSMCVAMSQGYIGFDLQNALREELLDRGLQQGVATVLTQVVVDGNDPAFQHPTKPIGAFMSQEEAENMAREKGWHVAEDAGRGWRQVVASPKPMAVVELTTIRALAEADNVVIACGGGGIPVIATDHHHLKGAAAVIDKDLASELLAEHLDADMLIILTAVEKVAVNFNKPNQKWLDTLTPEEARTYIDEGQFAPGSMLPKVEAAVKFAESKPGRTALITLLEKARDGIDGKTGTRIACRRCPPTTAEPAKKRRPQASLSFPFLVQDQQDHGQHQEHSAEPLGSASQLSVDGLGLVLGQERISHAADGTGQALALAGLEQHDQDDSKAAKQLQNSNNGLHSGQPPNIHSRTGAENHLTEVYNTIALSLFQVHFTKNICQSLMLFIEQMFAFQKKLWYTGCEIHCSGAAAGSCQ